jgi:hypothetical protein
MQVKLSSLLAVEAYRVGKRWRSHIVKTFSSQMVARLSAIHIARFLLPRNIIFVMFQVLISVETEGLDKLEKCIPFIGSRTRDILSCSLVSQPTALLRAPINYCVHTISSEQAVAQSVEDIAFFQFT